MGIDKKVAGGPGSEGAGDISFIAKYVNFIDGLGSSGRIAQMLVKLLT
jgi:glutamate carboxypeptidase